MKDGKYVGMILLQSLLCGILDIASKQSYVHMSVYCFLLLRYALGAVVMLLLWGGTILRELRSVSPKAYLIPGFCLALAFLCSNLALHFTAATNVSFLRSLSALIAPLLLLVFYRQKLSRREPFLLAAMLVGLYLLCAKGGLTSFGLGEVLALCSALLSAGSLVFGKTALQCICAKTLSFVQTVLAIVICGIVIAVTGTAGDLAVPVKNPWVLGAVVYAALAGTVAGYMLQNTALEHISAKKVGILQCSYPILAALCAMLALGEHLSLVGILGAVIITACVVLVNLPERQAKAV